MFIVNTTIRMTTAYQKDDLEWLRASSGDLDAKIEKLKKRELLPAPVLIDLCETVCRLIFVQFRSSLPSLIAKVDS